eukprot:3884160-Pyramimonas_sp.AAC.1
MSPTCGRRPSQMTAAERVPVRQVAGAQGALTGALQPGGHGCEQLGGELLRGALRRQVTRSRPAPRSGGCLAHLRPRLGGLLGGKIGGRDPRRCRVDVEVCRPVEVAPPVY